MPVRSPAEALLVLSASLSVALAGCKGEGGVNGPQALDFSGDGSCATGTVGSAALGDTLTVEGWVRSDPNPQYRDNVLLAWPGAFALFQDPDGVMTFTGGDDTDAGPSGYGDWMDGSLHHVAAQWVGGESALYLDGERLGINTLAEFGLDPGGSLHVGCWPDRDMVHEGLIDDVRVSGVARYDVEGFDPPEGAFVNDDDTFLLWHFDEGEGDVAKDGVAGVKLVLDDVAWVPFTLGDEVGSDEVER